MGSTVLFLNTINLNFVFCLFCSVLCFKALLVVVGSTVLFLNTINLNFVFCLFCSVLCFKA